MNTTRLITGILATVAGAGLLTAGGALGLVESQKDADGYLSSSAHTFSAQTAALKTEVSEADADLPAGDWGDFGTLRLEVDSRDGKPVFVGVAPTDEVERYLDGVAHPSVTDVDYGPFDPAYRDEAGTRRAAAPPAQAGIWAESATGTGEQTVTWKPQDGAWSVVVMNADGTPGVTSTVDAGIKTPELSAVAWVAGGTGIASAIAGIVLLAGAFPPRTRTTTATTTAPAAA